MTPQTTFRRAITDPLLLGGVLGSETWHAWRSILLAGMGEALAPDELATFRRLTGRDQPPPGRVEELLTVVGRRGGNSSAMAALAVYLAGLCDHRDRLAVGERGVVLCIAPDQKQARVLLDYCTGIVESTPILSQLSANRTADALELTNGISIEVRAASFRRLRGMTCVAVIADEAAFWLSDESSNPDTEILNAVRPSLATTGGPLIIISSPYARKGEVWETYRKHYGPDGAPKILIAQGASRDFNPSLPQAVVDRAIDRDPLSASAEYGGQFRTDIESFISLEAIRACIQSGIRERAPRRDLRYHGFVDPSGGSAEAFTMAVKHKEGKEGAYTAILDLVREVNPPFSPEAIVQEFSDTLLKYRVTKVDGDRYAGEWPREQFRKHGVLYEASDKSKSELFVDFLPLVNS